MPRKDAASEPPAESPASAENASADASLNEPTAAAAAAASVSTPPAATAAYHQRRYDSDDEDRAAAASSDHTLVFGAMLAALWGALSGLYHFFLHALHAMRRDRAATPTWAEFVEAHGARIGIPLLACIVCTLLVRAFWQCLVPSRGSRRAAAGKKATAAEKLASKKAH